MQFHPESALQLANLYRLLRRHFGYADPWWPGSCFQICITAVLVQQCDWSVAWDAVRRLEQDELGSVREIAASTPDRVQNSIAKVTFAPTKSTRLVGIAQSVLARGFDSFATFLAPARNTAALRAEVLTLPGVGPETADCFLNFASDHPVFVVDAYTRRIFERLNLFPHLPRDFWKRGSYTDLKQFFETHLLTDLSLYDEFELPANVPREVALLRDYHALLVELGKHHCLKTKPHCQKGGKPGWEDYAICLSHCLPKTCTACPLSRACDFATSRE